MKISGGTCSKRWDQHLAQDRVTLWPPWALEYSCSVVWAEHLLTLRSLKTLLSSMFLILVSLILARSFFVTELCAEEHIKYPTSTSPPANAANSTGRKTSLQAQGQPINGSRAISPTGDPGSDAEELRRAMSPASMRSVQNGSAMVSINDSLRGKQVLRPMQEQSEEFDGDSSPEVATSAERAASPDQGRAKSPSAFSSNRAISPISQAPESYEPMSMTGAAMGMNGAAMRSTSPTAGDRGKSSLDSYYGQRAASPTVNGFSHGKVGSTGNITADLIRDLKAKEAEVEALKKREAWMKAALTKASRSGFVYPDGEALGTDGDDDDIDSRKVADMVMNLKNFKAKIQASI